MSSPLSSQKLFLENAPFISYRISTSNPSQIEFTFENETLSLPFQQEYPLHQPSVWVNLNDRFVYLICEANALSETTKKIVDYIELLEKTSEWADLTRNPANRRLYLEFCSLIQAKKTVLTTSFFGEAKLDSLPGSIGNFKELTFLYLDDQHITSLPISLTTLPALTYLELTDNDLTELPECFGNFPSLTFCHLNNNRLEALPQTFGNLTLLKELYLGENRLKTLPGSIGRLSQLRVLHLNDNRITTLPETFARLSALERLRLARNQLTMLPPGFERLSLLNELFLSQNPLCTLPEKIGALQNLDFLHLDGTLISHFPLSFRKLKQRIIRSLNSTRLKEIYERGLEMDLREESLTLPEEIIKSEKPAPKDEA